MSGAPAALSYDQFRKEYREAQDALVSLGKFVDGRGLEKELTELVKLRISQINGCVFCVQLHLNIARKIGVDTARLDRIAAWQDAEIFTEREMAALAWAEHLTMNVRASLPEQVRTGLHRHFSEEETRLLAITVGTINAWNRIAKGLRFTPPTAA